MTDQIKTDMRHILNTVCSEYGIDTKKVFTKDRHYPLAECRYLIYHFAKKLSYCITTTEMGKYFNQDHCTVIHGLRHIDDLISTDHDVKIHYKRINDKLFACSDETMDEFMSKNFSCILV